MSLERQSTIDQFDTIQPCAECPLKSNCQALGAAGLQLVPKEASCSFEMASGDFSEHDGYDPDSKLQQLLISEQTLALQELQAAGPELEQIRTAKELIEKRHAAQTALWSAMLTSIKQGRKFTPTELKYYEQQRDAAAHEVAASNIDPEVLTLAQAAHDHDTLVRDGVMFDLDMIETIDRLVANCMDGKFTLLVGDKGMAKTNAAKYVSQLMAPDLEPLMISGHGDMMTSELIGQMKQDSTSAELKFAFAEGKLVQAMREGRPVILDEINFNDNSVLARLHDLTLKKPGDRVVLQENGQEEIIVQPGFVVFATANEASERYDRNRLDTAFRNRADVITLTYPDSDNPRPLTETAASLLRLALASVVDTHGRLSPYVDIADVGRLVQIAHVSQQLYAKPAKNAQSDLRQKTGISATTEMLSESPILSDCITPRAMADTLLRCADGNKPGMTLPDEIKHLIAQLDEGGSTHNRSVIEKLF